MMSTIDEELAEAAKLRTIAGGGYIQPPPTKYLPAKHRNGNGDPAAAVAELVAERDYLKAELETARITITELRTQLDTHDRNVTTIENHTKACIAERDHAVAVAGELRGLLRAVEGILRNSGIELGSLAGE